MILHVKPTSSLQGAIDLPASKSYSIRAFMIAACGGRSIIRDPSDCDDAVVARKTAQSLGSQIKKINSNDWDVQANFPSLKSSSINVRESGTVLRFVLPLLALTRSQVKVTGEGTLLGRPNAFLTQALRDHGVHIKGSGKVESVPIVLNGGELIPGRMSIDGSLSSQFISALLIACPQLNDSSEVRLTGSKVVSADYIEMTMKILDRAGVDVDRVNHRHYKVPGSQKFKGLKSFRVPSDYGLAAFPLAAAALTSSNVILKGYLTDKYPQADGHIIPLLRKMGVDFKDTSRSIRLKGPAVLQGGTFSLQDCPDLVPIMAVLALFGKKTTRLTNIQHARVKESDRITDLRKELLKVGAKVDETDKELIVHPHDNYKKDVTLNPHKDHRLAMAFAVLGLKLGVKVQDMECCSKSYPKFVRDFKALGASARTR